MPNGQETDALGDPSEPQVDVWVTDPEEAPLEPDQPATANDVEEPNVPFAATAVQSADLRVPPRGAAIPEGEPLVDTRDLPALPPLPAMPSSDHLQPAGAEEIARWQAVIADYEREAK